MLKEIPKLFIRWSAGWLADPKTFTPQHWMNVRCKLHIRRVTYNYMGYASRVELEMFDLIWDMSLYVGAIWLNYWITQSRGWYASSSRAGNSNQFMTIEGIIRSLSDVNELETWRQWTRRTNLLPSFICNSVNIYKVVYS